MKNNKSIDGLVTRSAKISAARSASALHTKSTPSSRTVISRSKLAETKEIKEIKETPKKPINDFLEPVRAFDFDEQSGELTVAKEPIKKIKEEKEPKKAKKPKKGKKMSKKRRIIISIVAAILVIALGIGVCLLIWGNDILARITGGKGNLFDFFSETYEPLKTDSNNRTNILAFGTSGYDMQGEEGNGVHDGAQLTDSIMLISLDQETGDAAMLSLPRDLKVSSTCTGTGKVNEIYWCNNMDGNNEEAGATALMSEVGTILGVDIQYYAHLNWGSLVDIVNILGGIDVTLDEDISDYYYTGAVFKSGVTYNINGEQALGLARARHGTESGDFSRGASQQKILIGIKDRIYEKGLSLSDILSLATTLGDNLRTNFSVNELKTVANLPSKFDFNNIRQISLSPAEDGTNYMTTGMINGISYVLPAAGAGNYSAIQEYVEKSLNASPVALENATILVLNAAGIQGLAGKESTALKEAGFYNITTDDAPSKTYEEGTTIYALNADKTETKSALEKYYNTTAKTDTDLPAGIPNNYDFVIILN